MPLRAPLETRATPPPAPGRCRGRRARQRRLREVLGGSTAQSRLAARCRLPRVVAGVAELEGEVDGDRSVLGALGAGHRRHVLVEPRGPRKGASAACQRRSARRRTWRRAGTARAMRSRTPAARSGSSARASPPSFRVRAHLRGGRRRAAAAHHLVEEALVATFSPRSLPPLRRSIALRHVCTIARDRPTERDDASVEAVPAPGRTLRSCARRQLVGRHEHVGGASPPPPPAAVGWSTSSTAPSAAPPTRRRGRK